MPVARGYPRMERGVFLRGGGGVVAGGGGGAQFLEGAL